MSTGATATVYAAGVRVADGSPGDNPNDPTVLSGLEIAWGRGTTVDQPEASTLTMDLLDYPGAKRFTDVFALGTNVAVTATGLVYPSPSVSTFPDPGMESGPPNVVTTDGTTVRTTRRKDAGTYSAFITTDWLTKPGKPRRSAWAYFGPLPFVPAGTDPAAWDTIPKTAAGQSWTVSVRVWVPSGTVCDVYAVYWSAPWSGSWTLGPKIGSQFDTGGGFATVSATITNPPPGVWVGVTVSASAYFYLTWDAVGGTWDSKGSLVWDEYGAVYVDQLNILAPAAGTASTVLVYSGRVVALKSSYDEGAGAPSLRVTCTDFTADLDNRDVGDTPWTAEGMGARFNRILALANITGPLTGLPVTANVDAGVASTVVSWRDVDRQPAGGLLRDLAATVDAICWSATHQVTGPYLHVEDPRNRPATMQLVMTGTPPLIVLTPNLTGLTVLSACEVPRDPVDWTRDVADQVTEVNVNWLEQVTGPPISTVQHTYTLTDPAGYAAAGARRYTLTSQLTTVGDAGDVAARIGARMQIAWRASGITLDDQYVTGTTDTVNRLLALLDGTRRNGAALALTDLPDWSPASQAAIFVEGGRYTFTDGRWVLDLDVSNAARQGASVTWDQMGTTHPTWRWDDFDPAVRWDDLTGAKV